jgi:L-ascorbate metabolism protein UlaG (beta-lactamase superfamily)
MADTLRFRNLDGSGPGSFGRVFRWKVLDRLAGRTTRSPDRAPVPEVRADVEALRSPPLDGLRLTWLGHASWLVQGAGASVLVDPVLGPSIPGFIRRNAGPGLSVEQLPRIDSSLVTHNHYDHLDLPTLLRLRDEHRPRFVVPLGNGALLASRGIDAAAELDWWQGFNIDEGVRVVCVPARHFSGRGLRDRDRTLWCGYVVEGPSGAVYFAGDTAAGPHFAEVRERFGRVRLALPIGAFLPRWFMSPVHVSPEEAVEAHETLGAHASVAIHFGTFPLGDDGETEAVEDLRRALAEREVSPEEFRVLDFGERFDVPPMREREAKG